MKKVYPPRRALIFDPYIDTLGGGERYVLTLALSLIQLGFGVELAWSNLEDLQKAQERFGFDLSAISINPHAYSLCTHSSILERYNLTKNYDLVFWVSDGSLPFLFGKNNLVHFQVPFTKIGGGWVINSLKLLLINKLVYNSRFTKEVIERSLPKDKGVILYPPIDTALFIPGKKQDIILSVARFDSPSHSKRQDILIEAFRSLSSQNKKYQLILAGGHRGNNNTLNNLKNSAKGLNIEIIPNPDIGQLRKLYAKAKFFWHAAGFEIDESKEPEKVEHFGMTTVEAMSAGCTPVVIAAGGQKEIVTPEVGFLVESPEEMASVTLSQIKVENHDSHSSAAVERAQIYSTASFKKNIEKLIQ